MINEKNITHIIEGINQQKSSLNNKINILKNLYNLPSLSISKNTGPKDLKKAISWANNKKIIKNELDTKIKRLYAQHKKSLSKKTVTQSIQPPTRTLKGRKQISVDQVSESILTTEETQGSEQTTTLPKIFKEVVLVPNPQDSKTRSIIMRDVQYSHPIEIPSVQIPRPQSWLDMAWHGIIGLFSWAYKAVRSLLFG